MPYSLQMKNITKKFGDFTANDNITLEVKKGEIHGILGENGAGKSTLMNILYGLYKATSGNIYIAYCSKSAFLSSLSRIIFLSGPSPPKPANSYKVYPIFPIPGVSICPPLLLKNIVTK